MRNPQRTDFAWQRLAELTDTFGPRLSGSEGLERAIDWAVAEMKKDGLENVRKEPVMVPKWVRGRESLELVNPIREPLPMLGLGNSVGTPAAGLEADVLVVSNFDELRLRAADAKGRIVLFNAVFTNYGATVAYRGSGPVEAARLGAVAVLVRSVGPTGLRTPHTGATNYLDGVVKIPAAAISAEDADRFARLQARGTRIRVKLSMEAHFDADSQSYNVVGELRGRELPDQIIVVGGHFDSWDPGAGASDDAGGCVVTWEALRLMKQLGLRPRRTVRVVLFTNEENGLRGGNGYRDAHMAELANHVLLLESDGGVFDPVGIRLHRPRRRPRHRDRHRQPAGAARRQPHRRLRRRRRHRPSRRRRQDPDDVARSEGRLLHDSPHRRRHDRAHHAETDVRQCGSDCGDGVCRGRGGNQQIARTGTKAPIPVRT